MITKTCETCAEEFQIDDSGCESDVERMVMDMKRHCDPCIRMNEQERVAMEQKLAQKRAEERWEAFCPPLYRQTDLGHPGLNRKFVEAAEAWIGPDRGLGFMGSSGGGKTRLLYRCLRRAFDQGLRVEAITHNRFSKLVIGAFYHQGDWTQDCHERLFKLAEVDVLLLDDLGKAPSTERCDAELEELIEIRGTHLRPILWSANGHGQWLTDRFGPDRGAPIVRRLAEFSTVVKA